MNEVKFRGGLRFGFENVTIPFASMTVNKNRLYIDGSVLGDFRFKPENITSVEPYMVFPFFIQGVKINHNIHVYPSEIIFWTFRNPNKVVRKIKETGFLD